MVPPKSDSGSDQAESPNISMLAHKIGSFWSPNTSFRGQNGAFKNQTSVDSRQQAGIDDQMSGYCCHKLPEIGDQMTDVRDSEEQPLRYCCFSDTGCTDYTDQSSLFELRPDTLD